MVKAPANSLSPDNSKNYQKPLGIVNSEVSIASRGHNLTVVHHSQQPQYHFQQNQNKKHRRVQMTEPPGGTFVSSTAGTGPTTLLVTTMAGVSVNPTSVGTPMIAVVAPTTRQTNTTNNSSHINGNACSPVKVPQTVNVVQQGIHAPHQVQHIYHQLTAYPVQIPANLLGAPTATAWPIAEPAFHFGPGFEPAPHTIMEITNQRTCPSHGNKISQSQPAASTSSSGQTSEHVVFFHVSPGVSVTFQISGNREVVRGK